MKDRLCDRMWPARPARAPFTQRPVWVFELFFWTPGQLVCRERATARAQTSLVFIIDRKRTRKRSGESLFW